MKTWKISAICILLTFLCVFTSLGYASISTILEITGSTKVEIPSGLFITYVSPGDSTQIDYNVVDFVDYTTTVDSNISKSSGKWETGEVTYTVIVRNNTKLTYAYRGIYYQTNLDNYNGNNYVSETEGYNKIAVTTSLDDADTADKKVGPGEELEFTVTYKICSGMSSDTNWKTLVNYQFGINVDGEREALAVVEQKFLNILNTTSTYEQLIDALDNKFDGRQEWTSNYIGNVVGSSSEDSVAVNTLFAGQLQITVGDEDMDATVLIKHENLDGSTLTGDDYVATNKNNGGVFRGYGCEMTLYLTIDPLDRAGRYVPVYAVVFTCDRDSDGNIVSDWYRIGSTYAGTANVVTYDGSNGTGSFVTDNWKADAATYQMVEGYSFNINGEAYKLGEYTHNISKDASIKTIVTAKDKKAVNTLQTLLNDAKRVIDNPIYAGMGIDLVEESLENALNRFDGHYTIDKNGKYVINSDLTIAQVSPAILDLYNVVNDALIRMDAIAKQQ